MSELTPIRGFVVEDSPIKMVRLTRALNSVDISVVKSAANATEALGMIDEGELTPETMDVAFIGYNIGASNVAGLVITKRLVKAGMAREAHGEMIDHEPDTLETSPDKIVTVGTASSKVWAPETGSYSDALGKALVVDWDSAVLNLPTVASEVRRLKEIN